MVTRKSKCNTARASATVAISPAILAESVALTLAAARLVATPAGARIHAAHARDDRCAGHRRGVPPGAIVSQLDERRRELALPLLAEPPIDRSADGRIIGLQTWNR